MGVKKPSMEDARSRYEQAVGKVKRIPADPSDSVYNVAVALENFAGMLGSMDNEIAIAIGDVQERLERIELMLRAPAPARRP